jgi:hypothetical protein
LTEFGGTSKNCASGSRRDPPASRTWQGRGGRSPYVLYLSWFGVHHRKKVMLILQFMRDRHDVLPVQLAEQLWIVCHNTQTHLTKAVRLCTAHW